MNSSSEFAPGFVIGAFVAACFSGLLMGDITTPAEYAAATKVCESNDGLKKIASYLDTQKVFCINGASFDQNFEKIEREAR